MIRPPCGSGGSIWSAWTGGRTFTSFLLRCSLAMQRGTLSRCGREFVCTARGACGLQLHDSTYGLLQHRSRKFGIYCILMMSGLGFGSDFSTSNECRRCGTIISFTCLSFLTLYSLISTISTSTREGNGAPFCNLQDMHAIHFVSITSLREVGGFG